MLLWCSTKYLHGTEYFRAGVWVLLLWNYDKEGQGDGDGDAGGETTNTLPENEDRAECMDSKGIKWCTQEGSTGEILNNDGWCWEPRLWEAECVGKGSTCLDGGFLYYHRLISTLLSNQWRYTLQVAGDGSKQDYRAGWGLFVCCKFVDNEIITLYLGTVLEISHDSIYSISNNSIVLDCKPWLERGPYLAAHLANNPHWKGGEEGTYEHGGVYTLHNAKIGPRYEFIATKSVWSGEELLLQYNLTVDD